MKPIGTQKRVGIAVVLILIMLLIFLFFQSYGSRNRTALTLSAQNTSSIEIIYIWPDAGQAKYHSVHNITNRNQIIRIVEFLNGYHSKWDASLSPGVHSTSGAVNLYFHHNKQEVGYWGIGPNFFVADGDDKTIVYRDVSRREVNKLLSLLSLSPSAIPPSSP